MATEHHRRVRRMQDSLGLLQKNFECPICLDLMKNPVSTKCDHKFCRHCLLETIGSRPLAPCPLCNQQFTKRSLQILPRWNNIGNSIRKLVGAFQKDTGVDFSPPRGPPIPTSPSCSQQKNSQKPSRDHVRRNLTNLEQENAVQKKHSVRVSDSNRKRKRPVDEEVLVYIEENATRTPSEQERSHVNINPPFSICQGGKGRKQRKKVPPNKRNCNRKKEMKKSHPVIKQSEVNAGGEEERDILAYLAAGSLGATEENSRIDEQMVESVDSGNHLYVEKQSDVVNNHESPATFQLQKETDHNNQSQNVALDANNTHTKIHGKVIGEIIMIPTDASNGSYNYGDNFYDSGVGDKIVPPESIDQNCVHDDENGSPIVQNPEVTPGTRNKIEKWFSVMESPATLSSNSTRKSDMSVESGTSSMISLSQMTDHDENPESALAQLNVALGNHNCDHEAEIEEYYEKKEKHVNVKHKMANVKCEVFTRPKRNVFEDSSEGSTQNRGNLHVETKQIGQVNSEIAVDTKVRNSISDEEDDYFLFKSLKPKPSPSPEKRKIVKTKRQNKSTNSPFLNYVEVVDITTDDTINVDDPYEFKVSQKTPKMKVKGKKSKQGKKEKNKKACALINCFEDVPPVEPNRLKCDNKGPFSPDERTKKKRVNENQAINEDHVDEESQKELDELVEKISEAEEFELMMSQQVRDMESEAKRQAIEETGTHVVREKVSPKCENPTKTIMKCNSKLQGKKDKHLPMKKHVGKEKEVQKEIERKTNACVISKTDKPSKGWQKKDEAEVSKTSPISNPKSAKAQTEENVPDKRVSGSGYVEQVSWLEPVVVLDRTEVEQRIPKENNRCAQVHEDTSNKQGQAKEQTLTNDEDAVDLLPAVVPDAEVIVIDSEQLPNSGVKSAECHEGAGDIPVSHKKRKGQSISEALDDLYQVAEERENDPYSFGVDMDKNKRIFPRDFSKRRPFQREGKTLLPRQSNIDYLVMQGSFIVSKSSLPQDPKTEWKAALTMKKELGPKTKKLKLVKGIVDGTKKNTGTHQINQSVRNVDSEDSDREDQIEDKSPIVRPVTVTRVKNGQDSDTDPLELEMDIEYEQPNLEIQPDDVKQRYSQSMSQRNLSNESVELSCVAETTMPMSTCSVEGQEQKTGDLDNIPSSKSSGHIGKWNHEKIMNANEENVVKNVDLNPEELATKCVQHGEICEPLDLGNEEGHKSELSINITGKGREAELTKKEMNDVVTDNALVGVDIIKETSGKTYTQFAKLASDREKDGGEENCETMDIDADEKSILARLKKTVKAVDKCNRSVKTGTSINNTVGVKNDSPIKNNDKGSVNESLHSEGSVIPPTNENRRKRNPRKTFMLHHVHVDESKTLATEIIDHSECRAEQDLKGLVEKDVKGDLEIISTELGKESMETTEFVSATTGASIDCPIAIEVPVLKSKLDPIHGSGALQSDTMCSGDICISEEQSIPTRGERTSLLQEQKITGYCEQTPPTDEHEFSHESSQKSESLIQNKKIRTISGRKLRSKTPEKVQNASNNAHYAATACTKSQESGSYVCEGQNDCEADINSAKGKGYTRKTIRNGRGKKFAKISNTSSSDSSDSEPEVGTARRRSGVRAVRGLATRGTHRPSLSSPMVSPIQRKEEYVDLTAQGPKVSQEGSVTVVLETPKQLSYIADFRLENVPRSENSPPSQYSDSLPDLDVSPTKVVKGKRKVINGGNIDEVVHGSDQESLHVVESEEVQTLDFVPPTPPLMSDCKTSLVETACDKHGDLEVFKRPCLPSQKVSLSPRHVRDYSVDVESMECTDSVSLLQPIKVEENNSQMQLTCSEDILTASAELIKSTEPDVELEDSGNENKTKIDKHLSLGKDKDDLSLSVQGDLETFDPNKVEVKEEPDEGKPALRMLVTPTGKKVVTALTTSASQPVVVEDRDFDSASEMAKVMANAQADLELIKCRKRIEPDLEIISTVPCKTEEEINIVSESEENLEEEDDVIGPRTHRRSQPLEESDLESDNESIGECRLDHTSSSAFSSQSETMSTQKQECLHDDMENIKNEMAYLEEQLAAENTTIPCVSITTDDSCDEEMAEYSEKPTKNEDQGNPEEDDLDECVPDSQERQSPDINDLEGHDESKFKVADRLSDNFGNLSNVVAQDRLQHVSEDGGSDEDLFSSPRSPSPPTVLTQIGTPQASVSDLPEFQSLDTVLERYKSPQLQNIDRHDHPIHNRDQHRKPKAEVNLDEECAAVLQSSLSHVTRGSTQKTRKIKVKKETMSSGSACSSSRNIMESVVLTSSSRAKDRSPNTSVSSTDIGNISFKSLQLPEKPEWCFVMSNIKDAQTKAWIRRYAHLLGCHVANKVNQKTTHVLMSPFDEEEPLVCQRTLKYFQGVSHGCWIVSADWVEQSLLLGQILPQEDFEMIGDTAVGKHQGPRRSRQAITALLEGYEVYCKGKFANITGEDLSGLAEICGASTVKQPSMFSFDPQSKPIILIDPSFEYDVVELQKMSKNFGVPIVGVEWLLDSIGSFKVKHRRHYAVSLHSSHTGLTSESE